MQPLYKEDISPGSASHLDNRVGMLSRSIVSQRLKSPYLLSTNTDIELGFLNSNFGLINFPKCFEDNSLVGKEKKTCDLENWRCLINMIHKSIIL